jgi:hypothetical protein
MRNRRNAEGANGRYWARTSDPQLVDRRGVGTDSESASERGLLRAETLRLREDGKMRFGRAPAKEELDPIEVASRDELAALQLRRLQRTLQHAYDNVDLYRHRFDAAGVQLATAACSTISSASRSR